MCKSASEYFWKRKITNHLATHKKISGVFSFSELEKCRLKDDAINYSGGMRFVIDPGAWWLMRSPRIRKKQVHFLSLRSLEPRAFSPSPAVFCTFGPSHLSSLLLVLCYFVLNIRTASYPGILLGHEIPTSTQASRNSN